MQIKLDDILKEIGLGDTDLTFLMQRLQEAIADPIEDIKIRAIEQVQNKKINGYIIIGGYEDDNELFVLLRNENGSEETAYLSKLPVEYTNPDKSKIGFGIRPHNHQSPANH